MVTTCHIWTLVIILNYGFYIAITITYLHWISEATQNCIGYVAVEMI